MHLNFAATVVANTALLITLTCMSGPSQAQTSRPSEAGNPALPAVVTVYGIHDTPQASHVPAVTQDRGAAVARAMEVIQQKKGLAANSRQTSTSVSRHTAPARGVK